MTKLEFLDKINDILIGLNTLESDLLGNLYDELMCDAGWHPASKPPKEKDVEFVMLVDVSSPQFTNAPLIRVPIFGRYINGWPEDVNVKWWTYPPED